MVLADPEGNEFCVLGGTSAISMTRRSAIVPTYLRLGESPQPITR